MIRFVLFIIGMGMVAGCAKPRDFEYVGFENPRVISIGLDGSLVGADVRFFNPNNYKLQLRQAEVDVHVNNNYLGKTNLDTLIRIPKKDTFSIPVVLKVKSLSAVTGILQSLSDSVIVLKLQGKVRLGKGGVFVDRQVDYEGQHRVKL